MSKPATLYDVARSCGVSYQTVSRVINGSPHVAEQTRRNVLAAIEALGYRPNHAARALVTRRTSMIEVVTYGLTYYGPAQMVAGVERAAQVRGYRVIFSSLESAKDPQALVDSLGGHSADGVIAITPVDDPIFEELERLFEGVPLIKIGIAPGSKSVSVVFDQLSGSQMITQHLIEQGHRKIAHISGPVEWYDAAARHDAWLSTLHTHKLEPGPVVAGDWTARSGYEAIRRLIEIDGKETPAAFSALVVANDQMALGAIAALRMYGLSVPGDISVVGFDDIPEAAYFNPPLTTVRQDFAILGQQSVDYLMQLINEPETVRSQRLLYPHIVYRDSTRALEV